MTDAYVFHSATVLNTKTFFPNTTIEWNRPHNNAVHADSVANFMLLTAPKKQFVFVLFVCFVVVLHKSGNPQPSSPVVLYVSLLDVRAT